MLPYLSSLSWYWAGIGSRNDTFSSMDQSSSSG
jgi:hypothetical protein